MKAIEELKLDIKNLWRVAKVKEESINDLFNASRSNANKINMCNAKFIIFLILIMIFLYMK